MIGKICDIFFSLILIVCFFGGLIALTALMFYFGYVEDNILYYLFGIVWAVVTILVICASIKTVLDDRKRDWFYMQY